MTRTMTRDVDMLPALRKALALCPKAADQKLPDGLDRPEELMRLIGAAATATPNIRPLLDATPDTLPDALDTFAADVARRNAAETAVNHGVYRALIRDRVTTITRFLPTALTRLTPVYDNAAAALTQAAQQLPAGTDALDPRTVLDAGAGDAHRDATAAMRTLTTVAAVLPHKPNEHTVRGEHIAAYAHIPTDVRPTLTTRSGPIDPAKAQVNKTIRTACTAAIDSHDLALVDLARGTYAPLRLALPTTPAEYTARVEAIRNAHKTNLLEDTTNAGIQRAQAANV